MTKPLQTNSFITDKDKIDGIVRHCQGKLKSIDVALNKIKAGNDVWVEWQYLQEKLNALNAGINEFKL